MPHVSNQKPDTPLNSPSSVSSVSTQKTVASAEKANNPRLSAKRKLDFAEPTLKTRRRNSVNVRPSGIASELQPRNSVEPRAAARIAGEFDLLLILVEKNIFFIGNSNWKSF